MDFWCVVLVRGHASSLRVRARLGAFCRATGVGVGVGVGVGIRGDDHQNLLTYLLAGTVTSGRRRSGQKLDRLAQVSGGGADGGIVVVPMSMVGAVQYIAWLRCASYTCSAHVLFCVV